MNVVKVITPLVHFLHFPKSIVGEQFNSKKLFSRPGPYFKVAQLKFACVPIYFDLFCRHFHVFCWPIFAFSAIWHVWTLCMFPQMIQVSLLCV